MFLKASIAGINVWYFFIRKNCFIPCLYQLGNTFKNKKQLMTLSQCRTAIELILVLYLSGSNFVPGGHMQFQLWYIDLIPFALLMTGIPPVFTYSIFQFVYPSRIDDPNVHHLTTLGLSFFLLTIGPTYERCIKSANRKKVKME